MINDCRGGKLYHIARVRGRCVSIEHDAQGDSPKQMILYCREVLINITRPPSSLTEGRRYITDVVRLTQRPRQGAN
jgi:hypothetical protein